MSENRVTTQQRKIIIERAKNCFEYCLIQARFAMQSFSIEHIIPQSKGGKTTLENLALACQGCNNHKYNKTEWRDPINNNFVGLYNPRQQVWHDHFIWNENFTIVIGLTPTGRATIEALKLNREGVVNLRQVLYSVGEHPPF
ncbi:HNH endonuclease signature motif containing protein [Okeania sp.]|uniref:HNH endonuclease n=1 Tax=Okeania sp. TaxID=3100323 RepID=UPI002B4B259F|nr:HNH endonuclease signature motif containing protein [Okeania sp.]MEB3343156.1 HNH endonuclease signature motif containing protein [Okeania sp.]